MKKILIFCLFVIPVFSCSHDSKQKKGQYSVVLTKLKTKKFYLDSLTGGFPIDPHYIKLQGREYLFYYSEASRHLIGHDYQSGRIDRKVFCEQTGPNKTMKNISSVTVINLDSVLFADTYGNAVLSNFSGEVYFRAEITAKDSLGQVIPYTGTFAMPGNRPIRKDGLIYFPAQCAGQYQSGNVLAYDLKTASSALIYGFSGMYKEAGNGAYSQIDLPYISENKTLGRTFMSLGAEPNIYVSDYFSTSGEAFFAGSEFFETVPATLPEKTSQKAMPSIDEYKKRLAMSPEYKNIIYDKYRNMYYRLALLGRTETDYQEFRSEPIKSKYKQPSIILVDSTFTKVGETLLPDSVYYAGIYFVSEEGLCLYRWSEDEDILLFDIFIPEKLK